ncbi:MAG: TauD/TfdA family dioxygenase [Myxococcota bacterium]|nr:TauD/TfdA family dioxygenase [Myxococcota bacterium]MDW8363289.1 TauD/TfdA family dioxygenase [Myxococcales bacterium]
MTDVRKEVSTTAPGVGLATGPRGHFDVGPRAIVETSETAVEAAAVRALLAELQRTGIARHPGPLDLRGFEAISTALGRVVETALVELRAGVGSFLASPGPVPLHTDHPVADVIGWWCERQDPVGGAMRLLDGWDVVARLDTGTQRTLRDTHLCASAHPGAEPSIHPVWTDGHGGARLFYAPWLLPVVPSARRARALAELERALRAASATSSLAVRLQPGEALWIDNHRILHGRGALDPRSPRRLHRVWVSLTARTGPRTGIVRSAATGPSGRRRSGSPRRAEVRRKAAYDSRRR